MEQRHLLLLPQLPELAEVDWNSRVTSFVGCLFEIRFQKNTDIVRELRNTSREIQVMQVPVFRMQLLLERKRGRRTKCCVCMWHDEVSRRRFPIKKRDNL